jgi:hypothetical protein
MDDDEVIEAARHEGFELVERPGPRTLRASPQRLHAMLYQGIMCAHDPGSLARRRVACARLILRGVQLRSDLSMPKRRWAAG